MMKIYGLYITKQLTLLVCINSVSHAVNVDGGRFSQVLTDIANNALGVNKIQEHYNSLHYTNSLLDGEGLVTEISASLSTKFDGPIQALMRIKQAVEEDIDRFPSYTSMPQCCHATGLTNSSQFRTKVNMNQACVTISSFSPPERTFPTTKIQDVMKDNHNRNPNLKWQYFGKEDGIYLNYPSLKLNDCSNYDPRFRPFYVSTATPVQKDVVVVIDKSGSMSSRHNSKTLLQIAKEAAISVLETLNPNDRFGVVAFSSNAYIPGSSTIGRECHGTELAKATPLNIKFMKSQVSVIRSGGSTNYEAAMKTAFKFFVDTLDMSGDRGKVILFLTDGDQTAGGEPLEVIKEENKKMNNRVVILTYGLGQQLSTNAIQKLKDMAAQTRTDVSYGEIQIGEFKHISNPDFLRSSMASYYNRFSSSEEIQNPIFSVPYQDLFGIGLISSICLPIYRPGGELVGVACSDATVSDIMSDISYFRQGELSYAFIIDGTGRTLIHPLLPLPDSVKDDPIYVNIEHLERSSSATMVIESMKIGNTGNETFYSERTVPRGNMLYEGIETENILSHYYWKPVIQSNFSVCIVVGDNDKQPILDHQTVTQDSFVYHRLDYTTTEGSNCRHFTRFGTKDKSVVMLTPGAFLEPFNYLDVDETKAMITKYEDFLTGKNVLNNPGLKESILNSVSSTYPAESIWKSSEELSEFVVWRYIGTADGVMRLYPGVELPKNYDHTRRAWYKRTLALKGQIVLSAPYLDLWGSGYLITLSKTITEGSGSGVGSGQTVAVIGTDFTINYFYQMMQNTYSDCQNTQQFSCFVLDSSGYIVIHEDFANPDSTSPEIENVHVIYKESAIAEDLINNNMMNKASCIDFETIKEQFTYRVVTNDIDRMNSYAKYKISPVPNSNIFIVIKQRVYTTATRCCSIYGISPDSHKCSSRSCDCLCYKDADFDYCNNAYTLLGDAAQTCSPRDPELQTENLNDEEKIKNLQFCFDPKCSTRTQKSDCFGVAGCSWCVRGSKDQDLEQPYCALQSVCYFGQVGSEDPYGNNVGDNSNTDEAGGIKVGAIAGIVIGVLIVVIIAGCVYSHIRTKSSISSSNGSPAFNTESTQQTNAHDNQAFRSQNQSSSERPSFQHQSSINNRGNLMFHPQNQSAEYTFPTAPVENPPPYSAVVSYGSQTKHGYPNKSYL
ncbi:VWFA and cache domain-containing protein 1-like isoform X1 [Mytilus galloprovincialis]|uniref:VWFA and cache domain-containing protein 1-like isoform X1 n=1 Tax=Mytilus galloprovincialis TaxID=29158 RepID=UPI003F7CAC08